MSRADAVRAALERHAGHASGMVALVGEGDHAEVVAVGRQAPDGAAMRRDSIFRIASMTKPVVAATTLMLIEDGKLALDEPVADRLPELANLRVLKSLESEVTDTVPAARPITVEDLLTFRLGWGMPGAPPGTYPIQAAIAKLGIVGFGPPDPAAPYDGDGWLRNLATLPLMAQPGERWLYTTGSNILGVLIGRVAGKPMPDVLHERVFTPLGMKDTGFHLPPEKMERLTTNFRAGQLYDEPSTSRWAKPPRFPQGDSGLVSTADDYFAFARFLMSSRDRFAGMLHNQLSPEQHTAATSRILGAGRGWGYGLSVVIETTPDGIPPGAFGWNGGHGTSWMSDPSSGRTAILLTPVSFGSADPQPVHHEVWRAVLG